MEHIKGAIRIEKYDAVFENGEWIPVGAPVDTVEKTNGLQTLRQMMGLGVGTTNSSYSPYIANYDSWVTAAREMKMWISEISTKAPCTMPGGLSSDTNSDPYWGAGAQGLVQWGTFQEFTYNDDPTTAQNTVVTIKYRFNPNVSRQRSIRGLGIWATTTVSLDSPFIQGTAQVLDIIYTINVNLSAITSKFPRAEQMQRKQYALPAETNNFPAANYGIRRLNLLPNATFNQHWQTQIHPPIKYNSNESYFTTDPDGGDIQTEANTIHDDGDITLGQYNNVNLFDGVFNMGDLNLSNLETPSGILIGTLAYSNITHDANNIHERLSANGWSSSNDVSLGAAFSIKDSDSFSAIQNLFPRTKASNVPMQDVDNLATGAGTITIDDSTALKATAGASGWTGNQDAAGFAKKYRVQITTSGDLGVSEYNLLSRTWLGTYENNWPRRGVRVFTSQAGLDKNTSTNTGSGPFNTDFPHMSNIEYNWHGMHSADVSTTSTRYDNDFTDNHLSGWITDYYGWPEWVSFDKTGVTIGRVNDAPINIDSDGTGTSFTKIGQVVHNGPNLYISDVSNGLYKVTRNIGDDNYTVSKLTAAGAANSNNARGVQIKNDGTIWAVFDEELCSSTDDGANWTVYNAASGTQFKIDGILDTSSGTTEPTRINKFFMDRYNTEDRFLFPTCGVGNEHETNIQKAVWWSRAGSTGTSNQSAQFDTGNTEINVFAFMSTWVSKNGVWVTSSSTNSYTTSFGTTSIFTTQGGPSSSGALSRGDRGPIWWEDSDTGKEFLLAQGYITNNESFYGAIDMDQWDSTEAVVGNYRFGRAGNSSSNAHLDYTFSSSKAGTASDAENTKGSQGACTTMIEKGIVLNAYDNTWHLGMLGGDTVDSDQGKSLGFWKKYGWNGSSWIEGSTTSRATHNTQESLVDGLNIKFDSVASNTDQFISTEYYDQYVYNGVFKDNATTYSIQPQLTLNSITECSQFESTVPSTVLGSVTEKLTAGVSISDASQGSNNWKPHVWPEAPGVFAVVSSFTQDNLIAMGSEQRLTGDFTITFKVPQIDVRQAQTSNRGHFVGVTEWDPSGLIDLDNSPYVYDEYLRLDRGRDIDSDGVLSIDIRRWSDTTALSDLDVTDFDPKNDVFTIERTSGTVVYKRNGITFYTSAISNTNDMQFICGHRGNSSPQSYGDMLIDNAEVTYTNNQRLVSIGNGVDLGASDSDFRKVITSSKIRDQYNSININGTPAIINYDLTAPSTSGGEVTILPYSGRLWFDSSDNGATITGSLGYVKRLNPVT